MAAPGPKLERFRHLTVPCNRPQVQVVTFSSMSLVKYLTRKTVLDGHHFQLTGDLLLMNMLSGTDFPEQYIGSRHQWLCKSAKGEGGWQTRTGSSSGTSPVQWPGSCSKEFVTPEWLHVRWLYVLTLFLQSMWLTGAHWSACKLLSLISDCICTLHQTLSYMRVIIDDIMHCQTVLNSVNMWYIRSTSPLYL